MRYNPGIHHRRSIRLKEYDYSQCGAYFINICTKNRECYFETYSVLKNIVKTEWENIPNQYPHIELDEYVIMPDHFHGILIINDDNDYCIVGAIHELPLQESWKIRRKMMIPKIVGKFKMQTAKKINQVRNTPGVPFWQRNYYEHIIRSEDELNRIREYIINNPSQWKSDKNISK